MNSTKMMVIVRSDNTRARSTSPETYRCKIFKTTASLNCFHAAGQPPRRQRPRPALVLAERIVPVNSAHPPGLASDIDLSHPERRERPVPAAGRLPQAQLPTA